MQNTKSSTSNEPDYKALLDKLLAAIHRDGGQYTILVGYELSAQDAALAFDQLRQQRQSLANRVAHLAKRR